MTSKYCVVVLATLLCGCVTSPPSPPRAPTPIPSMAMQAEPLPLVSGVSFQAVIVPSNFGVTAAAPPSAWTPTPQDVTMAEGGVQRCMAARCEKNERPLSRYVRQYYGQYRDQRKMLLVRFIDLASFPGLDWRRRAIVIFDAPISFMELLYDTQTGDCQQG